MSRYDLLPPNATTLERDFSRSTSSLQRAERPVPLVRTAKRIDIPDSVIPWLIYEYGLGEILPYITDQRQAVADGVLWQRIRGTPEAVRIALQWVGVVGLIEEPEGGTDRWAEYMLGLSKAVLDDELIDRIVGVATISSPVRSRLQRIYAIYDFRRAVYDECSWDDGSIYDDHSGVRPQPDWPQISFGEVTGVSASAGASVSICTTDVVGVYAEMSDRFRYDINQWDEGWHTLNHPAMITAQQGFSAVYLGQVWGAFTWQPTTWGDVNVVASCSVTTQTA